MIEFKMMLELWDMLHLNLMNCSFLTFDIGFWIIIHVEKRSF